MSDILMVQTGTKLKTNRGQEQKIFNLEAINALKMLELHLSERVDKQKLKNIYFGNHI